MSSKVTTTVENRVARVTLNRPEKHNGLDLEMINGLIEAGESLIKTSDVRAVVIHGSGNSFCAGLDFAWFMSAGDAAARLLERPKGKIANTAQRVAQVWQEVPIPVIAAIHGNAFGGGLQIALGADIRYVAADARLSIMEIKWGLIPDMAITQSLFGVLATDVASELLFTGRIVSGTEAKELGLATRVCTDPLQEALATAALIASKSPHAIRAGKRLLGEARFLSASDALKFEAELQVSLIGGRNNVEAIAANMGKRDPVFEDPKK